MDDDFGMEDLWDDAEEFERDELAQDHEEDDLPSDAFEDWRDDADDCEPEYEPAEDFGYFGEMGLNEE